MDNSAVDQPPRRHREIPLAQIDGYPELAALLTVWRAGMVGAIPPQRIDPLAIPRRLLPGALLIDLVSDGAGPIGPHIRLAGTMLCDLWGAELKGRALDEVLLPCDAAAVVADMRVATAEIRPILVRREEVRLRDTDLDYVALILPLADDHGRVTRLLEMSDPATLRRRRHSNAA
ncbi:PAS domain-containing protein [Desertibaculum subflavum]|uniref:PAS domain-containing protein n=1 Tax=Desertibaculum subflavum TaxID=2268458 RepID=UPI0013C450AD